MSNDELAARLLHTFLGELDEQVRVLNADLLAMERDGVSSLRLGSVFRVAHTLKGAARATQLTAIEELCHAMEGPLAAVQRGVRTLGPEEFRLFFASADALQSAGDRLRRGESVDTAAINVLARRLTATTGSYATPAESTAISARPQAGSGVEPEAPEPDRGPDTGRHQSEQVESPAQRAPEGDPIVVRSESQVRIRGEKLDELLAAAGEVMLAGGAVAHLPGTVEALASRAHRLASRGRQASARLKRVLERAGVPEADRKLLADLTEEATAIATAAQEASLSNIRTASMSSRASDDLMESVRRLRLRPFAEAVEALPRVVRDLATETGKEVTVRILGTDVEADRSVLDALREALLQLVRNAVDHGIEMPVERLKAGKPANGTILLRAALRGQRLRVEVRDDGRGLDLAAAAEQARARGRSIPLGQQELVRLLFESGVSTRTSTTGISGRGVGLDIVQETASRLHGRIQVESEPGHGTSFVIETPLTLATQRTLLVEVSGQAIAIPTSSVVELRTVQSSAMREFEGRTLLPARDGVVPVASMASVLGPPLTPSEAGDRLHTVVVEHNDERLALTVDDYIEETELVVRPLDGVAGAGELPLGGAALLTTGRIALVVSVPDLFRRASGNEERIRLRSPERTPTQRILVVDDSITTRTLEQSVLETAGYEVLTAVDGQAAWEILQRHGADLLLSDVEMPRVDGYELCEKVRESTRFAGLPVVLVTSLESPEQRRRGLEAGADAYVVKSSFDQEDLLETIRQLLGRGATP